MKRYLAVLLCMLPLTVHAFGTCSSSYYFSIPTVTRAAHVQAGSPTVVFRQGWNNVISSSVNGNLSNYQQGYPIIYQRKLVVNLNTCSIAFPSDLIDPVNADYWLMQNFEVWFDPDTIDCAKEYKFDLLSAQVHDNVVDVWFSVTEIP